MLFFTRELYEGYQEKSGWTRTATTKANRNFKLYEKYFRLIRPFLTDSAIRFSKFSFHDSELVSWNCRDGRLRLVLDTFGVSVPLPERYAHVTFQGVRQCPSHIPRKKEWWLYSEFHLGSRSNFCLHVMFTKTDVKIAADEIRVRFKNERS
jgi:Protein of unknown function (DUF4085)